MIFHETQIPGAYLIEPERAVDERGFFARTWCRQEFVERGLDAMPMQCSVSVNISQGTLRGMHYQQPPHEETKLIRCTRGAIYDVIVDLRPQSATFTNWQSFELTSENHLELYIPHGVAHGFLTLCNHCEVFYQVSAAYNPTAASGVRWDDPAFGIDWPEMPRVISERDATFDLLSESTLAAAVGGQP
jgi:dTDP-4-dehydrorhamnose 3,5-epimerase